jgi:DNA-binding response OmpR family regulator
MTKVLLIKDEAPVRLVVRVNLELAGIEVVEAADGQTGLEFARSRKPDLILLDAVLPRLDGWQLAHELLNDPATCQIPLVFLSAHADSSTRERALQLGALDYLTKPFDPVALPSRISELLARVARGEQALVREQALAALALPHDLADRV